VGTFAPLATNEVLDQVLGGVASMPDVRAAMDHAHEAAWKATEPQTFELCRLLVALLLHCDAEYGARTLGVEISDSVVAELARWPTSNAFTDSERAALAFTEQFVTDVASMSDQTAEALRLQLGDAGLNNFTRALLVIEQRIRLRLVWDQLLETAGGGER
jgi:alkylhydroperoxidase family enzyme